jgi:anthranilate phosphoribosyltransferase
MSSAEAGLEEPKLPELLKRVAIGPKLQKEITRQEVAEAITSALNGHENMMQLGIFLIALRMRGERMHEFEGILDGMLELTNATIAEIENLVELAEPFDGSNRQLNFCAFLPAVLAACGMPAYVSGVRDCGPKHGVTAAKIFEFLGRTHLPDMTEAVNLLESNDVGWAYCGQEFSSPALYAMREQRDLMIKRTALTTLERLLHPLRASGKNHLHIGYVHKAYPPIYARMAMQVGYDSACILKGMEGGVFPALDKPLRATLVKADSGSEPSRIDFNFDPLDVVPSSEIKFLETDGCEPQVARIAEEGLAALSGASGNARKLLTSTGALILYNTGLASNPVVAQKMVREALDRGSALHRLRAFIG